MNQQWEYLVINVDELANRKDNADWKSLFNRYGQDGWQLVGISPVVGPTGSVRLFFMRPKENSATQQTSNE